MGNVVNWAFEKWHNILWKFLKESRRQLIAPISFLRKTQQYHPGCFTFLMIGMGGWSICVVNWVERIPKVSCRCWISGGTTALRVECVRSEAIRRNDADWGMTWSVDMLVHMVIKVLNRHGPVIEYLKTSTLSSWVECLPMVWET